MIIDNIFNADPDCKKCHGKGMFFESNGNVCSGFGASLGDWYECNCTRIYKPKELSEDWAGIGLE